MVKLVSKRKFLTLFLLFAITFLGCGTEILIGPIVTGVVYWVNGEAHKYYETDPDIIYRATKHVLAELDQEIKKDEYKDSKYKIVAGNNNRLSITISAVDTKISRMNMRINYIGDKKFAELIYEKVDKQIEIIEFDKNGNPTLDQFRNRTNN